MKRRTNFLAAGAALLLAGCGAGKLVGAALYATGTVDKNTANAIGASDNLTNALKPISFDEEKSIGGAVALMAVARFGDLDPDEKLQRYVTVTGDAVASYSDRAAIPYYFAVIDNKEPNAFAAPGGYIFITRGLLDTVNDEAELAGVLGHEIAHVSEKHALGIIRRSKLIAGTAEVTAAYLDSNPDVFDKLAKEMTSTILDKGLDKGKELDADRIGTDYAHRLGYDARGLRDVLARLATREKDTPNLARTHPPAKLRVDTLDGIIAKRYPVSGGPRLAQRFKARLAR